ncbi:hypothetical protein DFH28DRAFT_972697 [Melampsora americana]|nr:hypothetical protein DFH28DRAFT_973583 [Melampsora americana]KAH9814223.1 hypothetical protein DFH28DRAFT_972697 [Melampsora americana]
MKLGIILMCSSAILTCQSTSKPRSALMSVKRAGDGKPQKKVDQPRSRMSELLEKMESNNTSINVNRPNPTSAPLNTPNAASSKPPEKKLPGTSQPRRR